MKKFFTVATMFVLAVGFAACGGGDDDGGTTPPPTEQPGDNPNDNPNDNPGDVPGDGTEVQPTEKFVNYATSKSGLTLAATHFFLEVSEEAEPVVIKFAVYDQAGQDVTADASIYVMEGSNSVRVADAQFTPTATGKYQFWASYKTNNTKADALLEVVAVADMPAILEDTNPSSKDFKRQALLIQATGTDCMYCPNAIGALRKLFGNQNYADKAVLMALHTYNTGDPLYSQAAKKLTAQAGLGASYPAIKINFDNNMLAAGYTSDSFYSFLTSNITEICSQAAETAIAVSTSYDEATGRISVAAKVKCDNPGDYKVTAVLVQDNVFCRQQGTNDTSFWIHEAGAKDVEPKTATGFALNNGNTTEVGDVYDFCCEFNKSALYAKGTGDYALDVLRDARILVYVQANGKVVDNVVSCGLNQQVGFVYND